jgi:hypothetical protein
MRATSVLASVPKLPFGDTGIEGSSKLLSGAVGDKLTMAESERALQAPLWAIRRKLYFDGFSANRNRGSA